MQRLSILISLIPILYNTTSIKYRSKIIEQLMDMAKINDMPVSAWYSKHNAYRCAGITLDKLYVKATLR